jgi:hypothetical protein
MKTRGVVIAHGKDADERAGTPPAGQVKRIARTLGLAQLGYAHWFFGNLYEAVVRVPSRLAEDDGLTSVLGAGSPVCYYLPGIVLVMAAILLALIVGWKGRIERRGLSALALATVLGLGLTAYLVYAVNLRLFVVGPPMSSAERTRLLRLWYRVNWVRLVMTACAWIMAARIGRRLRSARESL